MSLRFLIILLMAADSGSLQRVPNFSTTLQKKNFGNLNGAHLKFAVTHVSRNEENLLMGFLNSNTFFLMKSTRLSTC